MSQISRTLWTGLLGVFLGGVSFWLPIACIELLRKGEISVLIGTVLPLTVQLTCYAALAHQWNSRHRPRLAACMLVGLYLLGPLFMMIGATAGDGGFRQFHAWSDVGYLLFCSIFPPATLMLSAYDGTLFGVILSSAAMLLIYFRFEKVAPPNSV